jgi:hypothetical protein
MCEDEFVLWFKRGRGAGATVRDERIMKGREGKNRNLDCGELSYDTVYIGRREDEL